jgi:hypothetical protein
LGGLARRSKVTIGRALRGRSVSQLRRFAVHCSRICWRRSAEYRRT